MHCDDVKRQIDANVSIEDIDVGGELMQHLKNCDACQEYNEDQQLTRLLATLPVRPASPGFEARALRFALKRPLKPETRLHMLWMFATAASVIIGVLITLQFNPRSNPDDLLDSVKSTVIVVKPQETRIVTILLNSAKVLNNAQIRIELDDSLELTGYSGIQNLQWITTLNSGDNTLSLPIQLVRGQSGKMTIVIEHGDSSKQISVFVQSTPENGKQTVSMV
jgi:hypothetical protein